MPQETRQYHMERRNRANTRALLRGCVCAYLLFAAYQLAFHSWDDPTFPPLAGRVIGCVFAAAGIGFGLYAWKRFQADRKAAELTPQELAELADGDEG